MFPYIPKSPVQTIAKIIAALMFMFASSAYAQNLLTNPGFDTNVANWNFLGPVGTFDGTRDVASNPASGSVRGTVTGAPGTTGLPGAQCVATGVTAGTPYNMSGSIFKPSGQAITGTAWIDLTWFPGANCTGAFISRVTTFLQPQPPLNAWGSLGVSGAIAPTGTQSAMVSISIQTGGNGTYTANYDNIMFQVTPVVTATVTAIPATTPISLVVLALFLSVAGAIYMRSRRGQ